MPILSLRQQYYSVCRKLVALGVLLVCLLHGAWAQDDTRYRMELGGGLGVGFYLGDVNSRFYKHNGLSVAAQLRFVINPRAAVKLTLGRTTIQGHTASVKNIYPTNPNSGVVSSTPLQYQFSSAVDGLSALYELHFLPYGYHRGYQGFARLVPYLQAGVGLNYAEQSKVVVPSIPIGFGLKYKLTPRLNLGFDWLVHFTTSDRLDGLDSPHGVSSEGFKNKDHYVTTQLTLTYDIAPHCPTCNKDNR